MRLKGLQWGWVTSKFDSHPTSKKEETYHFQVHVYRWTEVLGSDRKFPTYQKGEKKLKKRKGSQKILRFMSQGEIQ